MGLAEAPRRERFFCQQPQSYDGILRPSRNFAGFLGDWGMGWGAIAQALLQAERTTAVIPLNQVSANYFFPYALPNLILFSYSTSEYTCIGAAFAKLTQRLTFSWSFCYKQALK